MSLELLEYQDTHQADFQRLNEHWIRKYFRLEEPDRQALENPREKILEPGGCILIIEEAGVVLGCCALIPHGERTLELAKMAVDESAQGRGLGEMLGRAAIAKAKDMGAHELFLESNRGLAPAIALYRKLGFVEDAGRESEYQRCDIQMSLNLLDEVGPV